MQAICFLFVSGAGQAHGAGAQGPPGGPGAYRFEHLTVNQGLSHSDAMAVALLHNRGQLREYYQRQLLLEPTQVSIPEAAKVFLEGAMKIVESHLDDSAFTVPLLVKEMGMSQSVFYRRIKGIAGQSVVEFIRDVRLKRAAQLLAGSQLRISEIAYRVGIDDSKYFREAFRKIYNMSPSEYARLHRPAARAAPADA